MHHGPIPLLQYAPSFAYHSMMIAGKNAASLSYTYWLSGVPTQECLQVELEDCDLASWLW